MNNKYFLLLSTILLTTMPACADYVNVTDKLNVRASAQLNSKIIDTLPPNYYVAVQYKNDDWAYIEYYSKQKYKYGWVKKEYLQPEYIPVNKKKNPTKPITYTQPKISEIDYVEQITFHLKNGEQQKARILANNYLKDYPNSNNIYLRAILAVLTEEYNNAIIYYTKLININPQSNKKNEYYFFRGLCYFKLEQYRQAVNDFNKVSQSYLYSLSLQSRYNYYYNKGFAEYSISLYSDAIFSYTNALEIKQNPELLCLRGLTYCLIFQYELAKQDLYKVINMCSFDKSHECLSTTNYAKLALSDLSKVEAIMHR